MLYKTTYGTRTVTVRKTATGIVVIRHTIGYQPEKEYYRQYPNLELLRSEPGDWFAQLHHQHVPWRTVK